MRRFGRSGLCRSGQFTQEDPIGLAGGLNLYGFAGGDPINFSDPFGLCAQGEDDEKCSVAQRAMQAVSDFLSSVPGQAIQAGAQAIGKSGEMLTSLVPGARGASEALAGASFGGESLDAGGRAGPLREERLKLELRRPAELFGRFC